MAIPHVRTLSLDPPLHVPFSLLFRTQVEIVKPPRERIDVRSISRPSTRSSSTMNKGIKLGFPCALRFSLHLYILATALLFALVTSFPLVVCRYVSTVGPMPKPAALIFEAAHLSQLKLPSRAVGCMVFFLHTTSFHALRNPFDIFGAISCLGLEGASFLLLNAHILLAQKEDKRHNVPRSDGRYIPRLRL